MKGVETGVGQNK